MAFYPPHSPPVFFRTYFIHSLQATRDLFGDKVLRISIVARWIYRPLSPPWHFVTQICINCCLDFGIYYAHSNLLIMLPSMPLRVDQ